MDRFKTLRNHREEYSHRIQEMADTLEKEQRGRNESEELEYRSLINAIQAVDMKMQALAADYKRENPDAYQQAERIISENAKRGRKTEIMLTRDVVTVEDVTEGGLVPLNIQDILEPLTEGFILDKVGLPFLTGLAGDYVWPVYEMVEATIAGEGVELADTTIEFSKLSASPERIGLAIPVSQQSLTQTKGVIETIVRDILPKAVQQLLNKILFSTTTVNDATNLVGPFVGLVDSAVSLSDVPTAEELNVNMKAALYATGVDAANACWIMTKATEAILEVTPISDSGIFKPMAENGKMFGLPIYTTSCIEGYIGLGDWRYQPMGLFGDIRLTIDPYSLARKDAVDFVINASYGTKTLREEAFILGKIGGATE